MPNRLIRGLSKNAPPARGSLLVRNLDQEIIERLKRRAAANGRSVEAEHRLILEGALRPAATGVELWERLKPPEPAELEIDGMGDQRVRLPDLG